MTAAPYRQTLTPGGQLYGYRPAELAAHCTAWHNTDRCTEAEHLAIHEAGADHEHYRAETGALAVAVSTLCARCGGRTAVSSVGSGAGRWVVVHARAEDWKDDPHDVERAVPERVTDAAGLEWDDELTWCPSQCFTEVGPGTWLFLRWRWFDPWQASIVTDAPTEADLAGPDSIWHRVDIGRWGRADNLAAVKQALVDVWDRWKLQRAGEEQ